MNNYKYDEMVQKGYNSFVNWNGEYKKKVGFSSGVRLKNFQIIFSKKK